MTEPQSDPFSIFVRARDAIPVSWSSGKYVMDSLAFNNDLTLNRAGSIARSRQDHSIYKKFNTLLTEKELESDHGLRVVGNTHAEQWLISAAFEEEENSLYPKVADWSDDFEDRLIELREAADEEAIEINERSVDFARATVDKLRGLMRPSIFLVGEGNIRFVWSDSSGAQVGWQFLTGNRVQFVMLGGDDAPDDRTYGEASLEAVLRQLRVAGFGKMPFS
jgi:hypothetical protein